MRAYFQYSRRTHLKPASDPIRPISPISPIPPAPEATPPAFICLYLAQFPVRFLGFGARTTYEVVAECNATRFATEDEAIQTACKHGCQPVRIRPVPHLSALPLSALNS